MTIFSLSTISCPSLPASSSAVVGRWKPVATSRVMSISGLPSRISRSMNGMMWRLGTGRVWSLMMIVQVFLPAASSHRWGEPIGARIAACTRPSSVSAAVSSPMWDSRISAPERSACSSMPDLPKGIVIAISAQSSCLSPQSYITRFLVEPPNFGNVNTLSQSHQKTIPKFQFLLLLQKFHLFLDTITKNARYFNFI